jgi:hypothetical protein
MALFSFRSPGHDLPAAVLSALALTGAEKVLAHAAETASGRHVVATTYAVVAVNPAGEVETRRPWHEVDAGAWEPRTGTISVTWTDGRRPAQWTLGPGHDTFADAFRERVTTSVIVSEALVMGSRTVGQATIRRDLATGRLLPVVVFGRGVRRDDPEVAEYAQEVLLFLGEQVGL